jgi:predicted enzyme related to lactoylglutathione lyase
MTGARFVWYELMTSDMAAAERFYGAVVGWEGMSPPGSPIPYRVMSAPTGPVAGIMDLPERIREGGGHPFWMGHIGVADADDAVRRITEAGGSVHRPPTDIPGVGRFAVVADPQGAVFCVFAPANPGDMQTAAGPAPGQGGWNELYATDWPAALDFYGSIFGWTKDQAVDMGGMGTYQLFAANGQAIGGMMNRPPQIPSPVWQYYFNVPSAEAAVARVTEAGGRVLMGPVPVPGGSMIMQCQDPQGAHFALVAPPV